MINFLQKLEIKGTVIDIGGSSGAPKVGSWNPDKHIILDNNLEKEVKQKTWIEPDVVFDLNFDSWQGDMADWVFCLDVFEYVWNPVKALETIYSMLKEGGIAVISFPFLYPHHNIAKADSLRFTRAGVENLLNNAGFKEYEIISAEAKNADKLLEFYELEKFHKATEINHKEINFMIKAIK